MASSLHRTVLTVLVLCFLPVGCATTATMDPEEEQTGIASYMSSGLDGRPTASGERYDEEAMTAAHRTLPFDTVVRVTNLRNDRQVEVRINDRGPFVRGRIIDVSRAAARELDFIDRGIVPVRVEVVERPE